MITDGCAGRDLALLSGCTLPPRGGGGTSSGHLSPLQAAFSNSEGVITKAYKESFMISLLPVPLS